MVRLAHVGLALVLALTVLPWAVLAQPCKDVVGYYPNWQWYDRGKLVRPQTIDYSKYTVLNYCFFVPKADGTIESHDTWADENLLLGEQDWANGGQRKPETSIVYQARQRGVKILGTIGGFTLSSTFPGIAADPIKRATFAAACVNLVRTYGFDGIDINWEYPGYAPHNGTAADKQNFTLLLQAIRVALDAYGAAQSVPMMLTIAVGAAEERMDDVEWNLVADEVDIINVMTYDYFGTWDRTTNHNSPLYRPAVGNATFNTQHTIATLTGVYGVDPQKLTLGMAFYGRSATTVGAPGLHVPSTGLADLTTFAADEGTPLYYNVQAQLGNFTERWDSIAAVPYLTGKPGLNTFVSYDNVESIKAKSRFAVDNELRGAVIWEITGDYMETAPGSGVVAGTPLVDAINDVFCTYTGSGPSNPKDSIPPRLTRLGECGTFIYTATDTSGLASITMGSTSADSNYRLLIPGTTPLPRDPAVKELQFRMEVVDISRNAAATVTVRDWDGNSVTDTVRYLAAPLSVPSMTVRFDTTEAGDTTTMQIPITNRGTEPITITSVRVVTATVFEVVPFTQPSLPRTLQPGQTLTASVRYVPRAPYLSAAADTDSLIVEASCVGLMVGLHAQGRITCDSFAQAPRDTLVPAGSLVRFSVQHVPTRGFTYAYQWQTSLGVGWEDVVDAGQYFGATTSTLWVSNVTLTQNRQRFRCVVTSEYCSVTSTGATLYVEPVVSVSEDAVVVEAGMDVLHQPYRVIDVLGRTVLSGVFTEHQARINVAGLRTGWYMVVVGSQTAHQRVLGPIVVER